MPTENSFRGLRRRRIKGSTVTSKFENDLNPLNLLPDPVLFYNK